jgi:hypothetical protein
LLIAVVSGRRMVNVEPTPVDEETARSPESCAGRQPGVEQRAQDLAVVGLGGVGRRPAAAVDQALAQDRGVDAGAVVGHLDDHVLPLLARRHRDLPLLRLAARAPGRARLDAVRDRVAQEVDERVADLIGDRLVELGLAAQGDQADALAGGAGERAHLRGEPLEQGAARLHADVGEAVLQRVAGAAQRPGVVEQLAPEPVELAELLIQLALDRLALPVGGGGAQRGLQPAELRHRSAQLRHPPLDPGAVEGELAHAVHQAIDAGWIHAQERALVAPGQAVGRADRLAGDRGGRGEAVDCGRGRLSSGVDERLGGRGSARAPGDRALTGLAGQGGQLAIELGAQRDRLLSVILAQRGPRAQTVDDLDQRVAGPGRPRQDTGAQPLHHTLELVRGVGERAQPDRAGGALERVGGAQDLGQRRLIDRVARGAQQEMRRLVERLLALVAKQRPQRAVLAGVERLVGRKRRGRRAARPPVVAFAHADSGGGPSPPAAIAAA